MAPIWTVLLTLLCIESRVHKTVSAAHFKLSLNLTAPSPVHDVHSQFAHGSIPTINGGCNGTSHRESPSVPVRHCADACAPVLSGTALAHITQTVGYSLAVDYYRIGECYVMYESCIVCSVLFSNVLFWRQFEDFKFLGGNCFVGRTLSVLYRNLKFMNWNSKKKINRTDFI